MRYIAYQSGYKYQLVESYRHTLPTSLPLPECAHDWFRVEGRLLTILRGYAWDGPSGLTIDTPDFMRGALVHDVLYQAMQLELVSPALKDAADRELQRICIEDGMPRVRAWWVYRGVQIGGGRWVKPGSGRKQLVAGIDAPKFKALSRLFRLTSRSRSNEGIAKD